MFQFGFFDEPKEEKKQEREIQVKTELIIVEEKLLNPSGALVEEFRINDDMILKRRKFNDVAFHYHQKSFFLNFRKKHQKFCLKALPSFLIFGLANSNSCDLS